METIAAFLHIYVSVQLIGVVSFPLSQSLLSRLPDRGYTLGKAAGVLMVGLVSWIGSAFGLLLNDAGGAWLALAVVGALAWQGGRPVTGCLTWLRRQWRFVLIAESLFVLAFAAWAAVRFFDPAIHHTEQPMDFMLMNALDAQALFPPQDPWLSGYSIGYYYLGYWLMNAVARLAGVSPDLGYNLLQSLWFGLLVLGSFGLGYNICRLGDRSGPRGRRRSLAGGVLAAVSVAVVGNLHLVRVFSSLPGELSGRLSALLDSDAWWRASRLFSDRDLSAGSAENITEFPSFSYVLGDNHPHVLAMPFLLLVVGLALDLLLGGGRRGLLGVGARRVVAAAVVTGALLALNTWDYPLALALAIAGFGFYQWRARETRIAIVKIAGFAGLLPVLAAIVFLPYAITAQSQARGLALNLQHATPLASGAVMFGAFVPGGLAIVLLASRRFRPGLRWLVFGSGAVLFAATFFVVTRGFAAVRGLLPTTLLGPVALGVGVAAAVLVAALRASDRTPLATGSSHAAGLRFALILLAAGLMLILVPEVVLVRDSFENRMNTVFKFWYQAWPLLALASSAGIVLAWRRGAGSRLLAAAGGLLLAAALPYPVLALFSKPWGEHLAAHPNALHQLRVQAPDEAAAIAWVREHVPPGAVVMEGAGASYLPEHNRISAYTGRPTLMGWEGHEAQWRGAGFGRMAAGRAAALETVYRNGPDERVAAVLDEWGVAYVYLGPAERRRYGVAADRERELRRMLEPVFKRGSVTIFRARGEVRR